MGEKFFIGLRAFVVVAACVLVTFLALPSPMRSMSWTPQRAPAFDGPFTWNDALEKADKLAPGEVVGPESIAVDDAGRVYSGTTDGKIVRVTPSLPGAPIEVFTETGGRPMGLAFSPTNGDLIVADTFKGLLRVDATGAVEVLAHEAEGTPLNDLNGVAVSHDGRFAYVTDSSAKWGYGEVMLDYLEAIPSGRVVRFDLETRQSAVLARALAFPNGIALAADDSYALVTETSRYRVTKLWLSGDRRNLTEVLSDNLPGFPDGIHASPRGTYWVALFSVRRKSFDWLLPLPFLKDTIAGLPQAMHPRFRPYGVIFELDQNGHPIRSFQDPDAARFRDVTDVVESTNGVLYLGSHDGTSIGRFSPAAL